MALKSEEATELNNVGFTIICIVALLLVSLIFHGLANKKVYEIKCTTEVKYFVDDEEINFPIDAEEGQKLEVVEEINCKGNPI